MTKNEKKKLAVFFIIAFGVTYLMGIPMYLGFRKDCDLSVFPLAQMMYPACGVILGKLMFSEDDEKPLPSAGYIMTLILTALLMLISFISIIFPVRNMDLPGMSISPYNLGAQVLLMPVCIIIFILFCAAPKKSKENAGLIRKNMGKSVLVVLLFLVLYTARQFLAFGLEEITGDNGIEEMKEWLSMMATPQTAVGIVNVVISYFLSFILFFGEEYGWRYYLQPVMQKKFGLVKGVLLLGIVWGLWHIPIDFMYYTKETGAQMLVNQLVTCTSYAIFIGFAYMKTGNFWVPVAIHYLNNNLIPVFSGNYSPDVLEDNSISWGDIPFAVLLMIFYILFIFAKEYRTGGMLAQNSENSNSSQTSEQAK